MERTEGDEGGEDKEENMRISCVCDHIPFEDLMFEYSHHIERKQKCSVHVRGELINWVTAPVASEHTYTCMRMQTRIAKTRKRAKGNEWMGFREE